MLVQDRVESFKCEVDELNGNNEVWVRSREFNRGISLT